MGRSSKRTNLIRKAVQVPESRMTTCLSSSCRQIIEDDYSFCPYCGTDNRPPTHRMPVGHHTHLYPEGSKYCVSCGALDELRIIRAVDAEKGKKITWIGSSILGAAILLFLIVSAIDQANFKRMMDERGRIEAEGKLDEGDRGPTYQLSPLGPVPIFLAVIGAAVTVTGAVMWINNAKQPDVTDLG